MNLKFYLSRILSAYKKTRSIKKKLLISRLEALKFFYLSFFYSFPLFRNAIKGRFYSNKINSNFKSDSFDLNINIKKNLLDLRDNGISSTYSINSQKVDEIIQHYISDECKIETINDLKEIIKNKKLEINLSNNDLKDSIFAMKKNGY